MAANDGSLTISEDDRREIDGDELLEDIDFDESEIQLRKRITRFDEQDETRLASMESTFADVEDDLVDEFYDHLEAHPELEAIFDRSTQSIEELKHLQSQYLLDLGRGEYDRTYFARRARIGKVHDMLDLGPKIYLGAYSIYYEQLLDAITSRSVERVLAEYDSLEGPDESPDEHLESALEDLADDVEARTVSLLKLFLLDQQIAMDTYIHSYSDLEAELERQKSVAAEVQTSIDYLEDGATDVEERTRDISDTTDKQVDRMQDLAGEMADLSATVEEIAASAEEVNQTSERAVEATESASNTASDAIDRMETVDDAGAAVADDIQQLRESVDQIDALVDVINDIAEQTNLLALNASIEAARAGEAGEGFAVVADEVKSLAEESQDQADRIEAMIEDIQTNTTETVESIQTANRQVSRGVEEVEDIVSRLDEIEDMIDETSAGIEEVADATDDQAASTEEVAAMIDQTTAEIEDVAEKTDDVREIVDDQVERTTRIEQQMSRLVGESDDDTETRTQ